MVFSSMFSALDNVIHSDFADPNVTFNTDVGTTQNQILSRTSVTVTINIIDGKSQTEQVSNLVESDLRKTNCNITGWTNTNYNQYQFTMNATVQDGTAICRVDLDYYIFSDKANRPYPGGFHFYWISDIVRPQISSVTFSDPQFRTSGEFGSTSPGAGYTNNYHTQKQTQNVTIIISEPNTDFSPSHVDLTNCYFSTGLTNPTGDTVTWTGAITASVGDQESKIRIEATRFRDLALGAGTFDNVGPRVNYNTSAFQKTWEWDTTSRTITSFTSTGNSGSNVNSGDLTNDTFITMTIVINKNDTNFFSKGTGLFEVNGGTVDTLSHQSGNNVFTVIVRPNSNQGTITIKIKDNSFQSRSMVNNTGSSTFTWNYDNVAPTTTLTFNDGSTSKSMMTSGPILGVLNFSETIYNLVTSGGSTSVRETQKGLGAVTFNTSSTSGSAWTWSINVPANTTQVSPPLRFQFFVGSVGDAAGNLTNDPGAITVPFSNEPVNGDLEFDTTGNGVGNTTSVDATNPTIILEFPEAVSGISKNSLNIPAPYQDSTFTPLGSKRYKWEITSLSETPVSGTVTITFNNSGVTVTSGKPLGTVNNITWSFTQITVTVLGWGVINVPGGYRPSIPSGYSDLAGLIHTVNSPEDIGGAGADPLQYYNHDIEVFIRFSHAVSSFNRRAWYIDPASSNTYGGLNLFAMSGITNRSNFTHTDPALKDTVWSVKLTHPAYPETYPNESGTLIWKWHDFNPLDSTDPNFVPTVGIVGTSSLPNIVHHWSTVPQITVTAEAWGMSNITGAYQPGGFNNYDINGFKDNHVSNTPGDLGTGLDELSSGSHQIEVYIKFSHAMLNVTLGVAVWDSETSSSGELIGFAQGGIANASNFNSAEALGVRNQIWKFLLTVPSQPWDYPGLTGTTIFRFNYLACTPVEGTMEDSSLPNLTLNWSTLPQCTPVDAQLKWYIIPATHIEPSYTINVPSTAPNPAWGAIEVTSGFTTGSYHFQLALSSTVQCRHVDHDDYFTMEQFEAIMDIEQMYSYPITTFEQVGVSRMSRNSAACGGFWNADGYLKLRKASQGGVATSGTVTFTLDIAKIVNYTGGAVIPPPDGLTLTWNFDMNLGPGSGFSSRSARFAGLIYSLISIVYFKFRETESSDLLSSWNTNGLTDSRGEVEYSRPLRTDALFTQADVLLDDTSVGFCNSVSQLNSNDDNYKKFSWTLSVYSHFAGSATILVDLDTTNTIGTDNNYPAALPSSDRLTWNVNTGASAASFVFNPAAAGFSIGFNNSCTITSESPSTLINGDTAFATDYTFRITFDYALDASLSIVKLQSRNSGESYTINSLTEITGLIVDVNITSTTLSTHTFTIDSTDYGDAYGNPGTTASFTWTQYATEADAIHGSNLIAYDGFILKYLSGSQLLIDFDIHKNTTLVEKHYETLNSNNNEGWAGYDTSNNFHPYMEKYTRIGPSGVYGTNLSNNAYETTIKYGELSGNDYLQVRAWYTNGSTDVGEYLLPPKFYVYLPDGSNSDWNTTEPLQEITTGSWIEQPLSLRPTIQTIHNNTAIHQLYNSGSTNWETKRVEDIVDDKNNYRTARTPSNTTGSGGCGYNEWKLTNWLTTWYPYSKIYMVFEELDND